MALEDVGRDLLLDAVALVGDIDEDAVPALGAAHFDARRTRPVAQRVLDNGGQDLRQGSGARQHGQLDVVGEGDRPPRLREGRLPFLALLGEDLLEVEGLGGPAARAPGDLEQILHHPGEPVDLLDACARLRTHLLLTRHELDLLQAQTQPRQGRAQLVGGIGGELPFSRESARHALRGAHQFGLDEIDLLNAGVAQARTHLARAELLGLGRQEDQRGADPS